MGEGEREGPVAVRELSSGHRRAPHHVPPSRQSLQGVVVQRRVVVGAAEIGPCQLPQRIAPKGSQRRTVVALGGALVVDRSLKGAEVAAQLILQHCPVVPTQIELCDVQGLDAK